MSAYVDHIVLRIRSDAPASVKVRSFAEPIIESHAAVTRQGGFSNPETDRAPYLQFGMNGGPTDIEYRAQVRAVDPGAWRILLHAVRGELFIQRLADSADVQCSLITASGERIETEGVASFPYPVSLATPPFGMSWIEESEPGRAAVHLSLVRPPLPDTAKEVSQFFVDWQRLIRAYPPPQRPEYPVGGALPTEAVWSHPRTIELALDGYLADEAVFHPIVNYACWLHRRVAVQELVID